MSRLFTAPMLEAVVLMLLFLFCCPLQPAVLLKFSVNILCLLAIVALPFFLCSALRTRLGIGGCQLAAFSRYVQLLSEGIAALVQIGAFLFRRQGSCSASKQSNVLNTRGSSASASITAAVLSRRNRISRIQAQGNSDRQRVMMCKLASLAQAGMKQECEGPVRFLGCRALGKPGQVHIQSGTVQ